MATTTKNPAGKKPAPKKPGAKEPAAKKPPTMSLPPVPAKRRPSKAEVLDEETGSLWTEIDLDNPEQREALEAARAFYKANAARKNLLTNAKAKVDAAEEKLIAAMGAAGLKKFRYAGVVAEIFEGETKCEVKIDADDDDA